MKKNLRIKASFMLLLFSTAIFQSNAATPLKNLRVLKRNYSGVEMYKGLFFFEGDFGKDISALAATREHVKNISIGHEVEKKKLQDDIITNIYSADPSYFNRLKKTVENGNFNALNNVLSEGAKLYTQAISTSKVYGDSYRKGMQLAKTTDLTKIDVNSLKEKKVEEAKLVKPGKTPDATNPNKGQCLVGAAVVAAIAWEVIWVVDVAVIATFYVKVVALDDQNALTLGKQSLTKEKLIVQIAESYSNAE